MVDIFSVNLRIYFVFRVEVLLMYYIILRNPKNIEMDFYFLGLIYVLNILKYFSDYDYNGNAKNIKHFFYAIYFYNFY